MLINILAIASPTHAVSGGDVFYAWARNTGTYGGHELIHSYNGSFFQYVFAHLWIDFQPFGKDHPPANGPISVDWWENSVQATLANQEFTIDHSDDQVCDGDSDYTTYSANALDLTAADGFDPDGDGPLTPYQRLALADRPWHTPGSRRHNCAYGAARHNNVQPDIAIAALKHFFTDTEVWNYRLGFGDAYNLDFPDCNGPWYNHAVFGIDNGPM